MPGLNLGVGAQVRGTAIGSNAYGASPPPTTATAAAFGPAATPAASSANLTPTTPGGLAFWVGVAGVAFLAAVYYSLPG
jgi:hypothetical protein